MSSNETAVVHCRRDEHDIYIGRGGDGDELNHMNNTPVGERGWLGNPYIEGEDGTRREVVRKFGLDFYHRIGTDEEFRDAVAALQGQRLGCWCDPEPCHGEIIALWCENRSEDPA
jgi:hypothetical protein